MSANNLTKTASEVREYLLSRTGNHPEDIREANEIADEIDGLRAALKRYAYPPDHRVSVAEAECDRLRAALEMLYDKWENGDPCYADPETFMGGLGNAFKLTAEEEEGVLALIGRRPENCHKPLPHEPTARLTECPFCQHPADSAGCIYHEPGCEALKDAGLNKLQYWLLTHRPAQKSDGESHGR